MSLSTGTLGCTRNFSLASCWVTVSLQQSATNRMRCEHGTQDAKPAHEVLTEFDPLLLAVREQMAQWSTTTVDPTVFWGSQGQYNTSSQRLARSSRFAYKFNGEGCLILSYTAMLTPD
jgi:hypothetical protein